MKKYLIDTNLPYFFGLWKTEEFIHQNDLNPKTKDKVIWRYAKQYNLTIITKDADFSNRMLLSDPPPRVIHIKFGNLTMSKFYDVIHKNWNIITEMSACHKLVNVYIDRIEGVD